MTCDAFLAVSLDGYIAGPGGDLSWLTQPRFALEGEDFGFADFLEDTERLLMGRHTYDAVAGFSPWPYGTKPVTVLTRRAFAPPPADRRVGFYAGGLEALLSQWDSEVRGRVYLDGGQVVASALQAGRLNSLTLTVLPVVLGGGVPLFPPAGRRLEPSLRSSRSWPNGFVQNVYRF